MYRSLGAGIKAAADASNPAVLVASGTYCETLLVEAAVEISRDGEGEVLVEGQGCHTVSILAGTVKLKGITLRSTGTGPWSAVFVGGTAAVTLESCTVQSLRGPALVTSSSAACTATSQTTFSSELGSGALIVNKASFTASNCTFTACALNGVEARDASSASATSCEMTHCRRSGVLSCDEGSSITCKDCSMTNCLTAGASAENYGSVVLEKCSVVRNQGSGVSALDGGIVTATDGAISSNAGHGVFVRAAAATLSKLHVDFNARHGLCAGEQSTIQLDSVHFVNNSQKSTMLSPRTKGSASESDVVAKDVWWPSPNCGPKELYVD